LSRFDEESETLAWVLSPGSSLSGSMFGILRHVLPVELQSCRRNNDEGKDYALPYHLNVVYPGELTVGGVSIKRFLNDPEFYLSVADPLSFLKLLLQRWLADIKVALAAEAEAIAAAAGSSSSSSSSQFPSGDLLRIASAVVILLKGESPRADPLIEAYAARVVDVLKCVQDVGAFGGLIVSPLRLLNQMAKRSVCIETLTALEDGVHNGVWPQLVRLLEPNMVPDAALVVEAMMRLLVSGKGASKGDALTLCTVLEKVVEVIESPNSADVIDPAATKVHVVEILKFLAQNPQDTSGQLRNHDPEGTLRSEDRVVAYPDDDSDDDSYDNGSGGGSHSGSETPPPAIVLPPVTPNGSISLAWVEATAADVSTWVESPTYYESSDDEEAKEDEETEASDEAEAEEEEEASDDDEAEEYAEGGASIGEVSVATGVGNTLDDLIDSLFGDGHDYDCSDCEDWLSKCS